MNFKYVGLFLIVLIVVTFAWTVLGCQIALSLLGTKKSFDDFDGRLENLQVAAERLKTTMREVEAAAAGAAAKKTVHRAKSSSKSDKIQSDSKGPGHSGPGVSCGRGIRREGCQHCTSNCQNSNPFCVANSCKGDCAWCSNKCVPQNSQICQKSRSQAMNAFRPQGTNKVTMNIPGRMVPYRKMR
eukprot:gnl/MRDRNA2_/MRDRNA2_81326_c0_seq4.p1 gnl/MRDRNA2_/MRDRNA2_81326_c0~~gnl/MRDRNA2_/MRDRNA2_81326_c0_seq4.p1  ORF type:complete len:185 (-),score=22.54 gnl/MRDRNA2_/MRDRNA2_81326_c0_seq4:69-623(-)